MTISARLGLREESNGSGALCRRILATLPTWFGIPEAVEDYVAVADRSPAVVASLGADDIGFLTLVHHSPYAAEIYVMGVVPEHHRNGIARALLEYTEASLARAGIEFLQVKTLSPRHPDAGYLKTRAFYVACGFRPLEEFPDLWNSENPALQMVKWIGGT